MKLICPLCKQEMQLYQTEFPKFEDTGSVKFGVGSLAIKVKEITKFYFKCYCSVKLEFESVNYDVSILYSDRDKAVNHNNALYFHKTIADIHKKDTEYFRKKLL